MRDVTLWTGAEAIEMTGVGVLVGYLELDLQKLAVLRCLAGPSGGQEILNLTSGTDKLMLTILIDQESKLPFLLLK